MAELPLNCGDIAGFFDQVPALGGRHGGCGPRPARLQTSLNTVLTTLGLRRPLPWVVVVVVKNSADAALYYHPNSATNRPCQSHHWS